MKTFAQYLTESRKIHEYRIKIVGDVPAGFMKSFRDQLKKFDPQTISEPKTTPVQPMPRDFPNYPNQSVTMVDVAFRYPATPPQIQQMVELLGLAADRVSMSQKDYEEGMDQEIRAIGEQNKDLLVNPEYPKDTAEQRDLKKDYAAAPKDKNVVKNSADAAVFTVAGGKTPPAETTNDLPMGIASPMTKIKRPPMPATGFQK